MPYAILRTKKLKSMAGVFGSGRHTFREIPTHNSNGAPNVHLSGATSAGELADTVRAILPERRRKDAVLCIEYLITASPEAFTRQGGHLDDYGRQPGVRAGYFDRAMAWLKAQHGEQNIVCAITHLDERTPHLVAYVVPMTKDGRLSAREFLGGAAKLRKMQTDFHRQCGMPLGLNRGIEGSKATHQSVSRYYKGLEVAAAAPTLTRADYAAAAVGISTTNVRAVTEATEAASIMRAQEQTNKRAIESRRAALESREVELLRHRRALDEFEARLESQAALLGEFDRELAKAQDTAERYQRETDKARAEADKQRSRADRLLKKLKALCRRFGLGLETVAP